MQTKFHYNAKETAAIMGVSVIALNQWDVAYDFKKGRSVYYDIRKVIQYRVNREDKGTSASLTDQRARLARVQADKVEEELKIMKGESIPITVVAEYWQNMVMNLRLRLLDMGPVVSLAAFEATSLKDIEDAVAEKIYESLEEISSSGIPKEVKPTSNTDDKPVKATTKTKRKPVGRPKKKTKSRSKRSTRAVAN